MSYALERISDSAILATYANLPKRIDLPGTQKVLVMGDDLTGWTDETYALVPYTPPVVAPTKQELKDYTAAKRYVIETSGLISQTFGPLLTDRATQNTLASTIQSIDLGIVTPPINFKAPSGFASLDRSTLVAIATVVGAHVQAAFNTEMTVVAEIEAETIATFAEIDAADWPSNA